MMQRCPLSHPTIRIKLRPKDMQGMCIHMRFSTIMHINFKHGRAMGANTSPSQFKGSTNKIYDGKRLRHETSKVVALQKKEN